MYGGRLCCDYYRFSRLSNGQDRIAIQELCKVPDPSGNFFIQVQPCLEQMLRGNMLCTQSISRMSGTVIVALLMIQLACCGL